LNIIFQTRRSPYRLHQRGIRTNAHRNAGPSTLLSSTPAYPPPITPAPKVQYQFQNAQLHLSFVSSSSKIHLLSSNLDYSSSAFHLPAPRSTNQQPGPSTSSKFRKMWRSRRRRCALVRIKSVNNKRKSNQSNNVKREVQNGRISKQTRSNKTRTKYGIGAFVQSIVTRTKRSFRRRVRDETNCARESSPNRDYVHVHTFRSP
jgi:hypothetical protein